MQSWTVRQLMITNNVRCDIQLTLNIWYVPRWLDIVVAAVCNPWANIPLDGSAITRRGALTSAPIHTDVSALIHFKHFMRSILAGIAAARSKSVHSKLWSRFSEKQYARSSDTILELANQAPFLV